jgi:cysteine desulfurase
MSNIASTSLRQASRLCVKKSATSSAILRTSTAPRVAAISCPKATAVSRRGYVSETKKDNAQVNIDTAIRANQKAFFAETGKLPENQMMPGTTVTADTTMSPIAGRFLYSFIDMLLTVFQESSGKRP